MKTTILALVLAMSSMSANADDNMPANGQFHFAMAKAPSFGTAETALTLHVIDWAQTQTIAKDCHKAAPTVLPNGQWSIDRERFAEANPLLGRCPSMGKTNAYFLLSGVALYAAAKMMPEGMGKDIIKYGWLTVEGGAVAHNVKMGIAIKF